MPGEESVRCIFERYVEMNAHAWSYLGYVLRQGLEEEEAAAAAAESKKEKETHCNTPTCDLRSPFGPAHEVVVTLKVKAGVVSISVAPLRSPATDIGPTHDVVASLKVKAGGVSISLAPATDTHELVTMFREADFEKNLTGNWVVDESEDYGRCGMAINHLIPVMDVRYTDDLTVDPTDGPSQDMSQDGCGPETCPHQFVRYLP